MIDFSKIHTDLTPPFTIVNKVEIEDHHGAVCIADNPEIAKQIVEALVEKYAKVVTERVDP